MKMKPMFALGLLACAGTAMMSLVPTETTKNEAPAERTPVSELLISLGDSPQKHYIKDIDPKKVALGEEIVLKGNATMADGTRSPKVSEFFVCTDCHNIGPEAPKPLDNDPEVRLRFAMDNNIPYLPGSTFRGIVNRTGWFNGDHIKKYGDLVKPANHDLHNAVQLCSRECSSGRYLEDWELEAVMHYLTTLQLTVGELGLADNEMAQLTNPADKAAAIALVKSRYLDAMPATFLEPLPLEQRAMGLKGDVTKGKFIYENSCMHCHKENGVTKTVFGTGKGQKDATWLASYLPKSNGGSIYYICRKGTSPKKKTPQYMPIYSNEKLTDGQIEDLVAYVSKMAGKP
ncbi:MAG: cytochrome c [Flavobacteriales bacterium]|nr:cytochrome c [Flavobacteriales bacterium]